MRWAQVLWDTLGQQPTAACARRPRWVWTQALADFSFAERAILVRWIKRWIEYRELTSSYTFLIQIGTCWDIVPKKLKTTSNLKEIFGSVSVSHSSAQKSYSRDSSQEHPSCGTHREEWHPLTTGESAVRATLEVEEYCWISYCMLLYVIGSLLP